MRRPAPRLSNPTIRLIGAVIGGFEVAVWPVFCIGLVVDGLLAAVLRSSEWSAQTRNCRRENFIITLTQL